MKKQTPLARFCRLIDHSVGSPWFEFHTFCYSAIQAFWCIKLYKGSQSDEPAVPGDLTEFPEDLNGGINAPLRPPPDRIGSALGGYFARQQAWSLMMATLTREQRLHIQEYADAATAIWQQIVKEI
ncbi:hypothetical protein PGTUg99_005472 [Puccinia graminis f. sp. tritici]|uniref:Uncharacterized protein n=1 Tax=Puccinia graminis f. sp. tritici TaxID=56615 RepID=A0A5B0PPM8_PUCGR|nr:hypothetical protein PGTUg99_005472 [Puccinia graminis f. sp. tritici]